MLKDKEYVYAVYKEGSFSKAAEKLFISQPALSRAVKNTEQKAGVLLFRRDTYPVSLTPAGEYYISCAEKVMKLENEMKTNFKKIREENKNIIKIGGSAYFCAHIIPDLALAFQKQYPSFSVLFSEEDSSNLHTKLQNGSLDFIIDVDKFSSSLINSKVLAQEKIILAVPSSLNINKELSEYRLSFNDIKNNTKEYNNKPKVNLNNFKNEKFIFLKKGNDTYTRGKKMCISAGFTPNISIYADQLLTSYYIALSGSGIAFIRSGLLKHVDFTDKVCFYKINDSLSLRDINLYYKNSSLSSEICKRFLSFINNFKDINLYFN